MKQKLFMAVIAAVVLGGFGIGYLLDNQILAAPSFFDLPPARTDDLRVQGWFAFDNPDLAITEYNTGSMTLPAQLPLYTVSASEAMSTSASTAVSDGTWTAQQVTFYNRGSYNLTIKNSANTDLGTGDVVLGPTDILTLLWNGSDWIRWINADN